MQINVHKFFQVGFFNFTFDFLCYCLNEPILNQDFLKLFTFTYLNV